ncbi:MAG: STAS domain-containing protein [Phycisphaerae bacterium]|nr:STAS domain-containing protein [Phycisphaerae bacterium]
MVLKIDNSGVIPVAKLIGEWRATDAQEYENELHPLVAEAGAKLIIDLGKLEMIDSSGLAALISVVTHARLSNAQVVLVAPSAFVGGVFEVTRLDHWLDICRTLDEAARKLGVD